ncbi:MAG TPA: ABC transporter ATP-binding protein [Longimicrobiales bacterium]|nr:ABC transporter ATP-binding protein [Longimicrobiales bacterium]
MRTLIPSPARAARSGTRSRSGSTADLGPGAEKDRSARFRDAWPEVKRLLHRHRRSLALGLVLMLFNRVAGLVLPGTTKFLIDDVVGQGNMGLLLPLAGVAALATLVQASTAFGLAQVVSVAGQRAIAEMRESIQAHVIHLPVSYFDSTKSGVLISRVMSDAEGIRNLVGTGIINLVGGFFTAIVAAGLLFYLNWQMTLAVLVVLLTFGAAMATAFKRLRPIFRERGKIHADVTGRLAEGLGGIRVVKTYVAEPREEAVFSGGVMRLFKNISSTILGTSAVSAFATLVVGALGVMIMIMGGQAIAAGTMTLGDFVLYIFYVGLMAAPLVQIAGIGTQLTEAFAGLDRIRELRRVAREDADEDGRTDIGDVHGDVAFEDVSFEYTPGVPVVREVSFHAPAGSTTALVGPSGAGKSTLIGLVMAFHRPTEGTVRVDGHDLSEVRLHGYRRHLGVVPQDNFLFDGTIRENIAYGRPDAAEEDIRRAAAVAHCDEFIDRFEDGLDTIIGERGVKLSGGQRQRVAIARAVLADPRILILDEATSSLDSESEAMIRDGMNRLRHGRTTFVIAHRLSTIRSADQILVMDDGAVVERGTHEELLALGGLYRRLYEKQHGVESDRFINPGEEFGDEAPDPRADLGAAARPARSL